jgi:hypothetical protein
VAEIARERDGATKVTIVPQPREGQHRSDPCCPVGRSIQVVARRTIALSLAVCCALTACSGSDGTDDEPPSIGGINGPAVVDPSFDPFATDPSAPPAADGG